MLFYAFLGANKYIKDNYIPHYKSRIQKQNPDYFFVVKVHYEEYHSLVDKCLTLYLKNLILLGVVGHIISYMHMQCYLQLCQ